jgi:hypothetical protein
VINPHSEGAATFVKDQQRRADFKTIAIQDPDMYPQEAASIDGIDAALVKPARRHKRTQRIEWTGVVDSMMRWVR